MMARPGLIRADTLDLQDHDSPSSQDHSKKSIQHSDFSDNLIGPHQSAEVRHVIQERQNEERNLQDSWGGRDDDESEVTTDTNGMDGDDGRSTADSEAESTSDDDLMDRISSSPSIDDEDIDFDFVYALHTFVATVEGQANATKGDTMVLLDDSNSYWWLVRVVKDSSIGYLPAEHIETPTERLARLNKHRNVDLSAAMLGDNLERSKNPIKKAIRRRNTKNVQFAAPTYVEASDYDYSSDEADEGPDVTADEPATNGTSTQAIHEKGIDNASVLDDVSALSPVSPTRDGQTSMDDSPVSPRPDKADASPSKSRKGNSRSSDSWLKEETGETRKLTLTPNLLRDDSSSVRSGDTREGSFDSLEKTVSPPEKVKEDKKKKEKKSGMLSRLFKGDKKEKKEEKVKKKEFVSDNEVERVSIDAARHSTASLPAVDPVAKSKEVNRKASQQKKKLQKSVPGSTASMQAMGPDSEPTSSQFMAELEGSQVAIEAPTGLEHQIPVTPVSKQRTKKAKTRQVLDDFDEAEEDEEDDDAATVMTQSSFMHGTEAVHIPMQSEMLESSDDEPEQEDEDRDISRGPSSTPPSVVDEPQKLEEGEEKEPVQTEMIVEPPMRAAPPAPVAAPTLVESSEPERTQPEDIEPEQTDDEATPIASKPQSPLPVNPQSPIPSVEAPQSIPMLSHTPPPGDEMDHEPQRQDSKSSTMSSRNLLSPSPASTNTTWSDAGLRAWLDGDNDIRDMLVVIHDKSGVKPVGSNHPLMSGLFAEETKTLKGLSDELDGLLGGFLSRRPNAVSAQL